VQRSSCGCLSAVHAFAELERWSAVMQEVYTKVIGVAVAV
jgi:hypothetical protein